MEPQPASHAHWVRFDRYSVQEGYIRPAPDAELETFDAWIHDGGADSDSRVSEPSYGSLLNLVQSIELKPKPGPGPLLTLSDDSEGLVTDWCANHGLLGILPHRVQMVTLAPHYDALPDVEERWVPWQRQFFRVNHKWVMTHRWGVWAGNVQEGSASRWKDKLVPADEVPREWPKPHVLLQDLETGQCDVKDRPGG